MPHFEYAHGGCVDLFQSNYAKHWQKQTSISFNLCPLLPVLAPCLFVLKKKTFVYSQIEATRRLIQFQQIFGFLEMSKNPFPPNNSINENGDAFNDSLVCIE